MADVFIRIELLGEPGGDIYAKLHTLMGKTKGWFTVAVGSDGKSLNLPHAMYKGSTNMALLALAESLKKEIVASIWSKGAIVLVVEWSAWAQSGNK